MYTILNWNTGLTENQSNLLEILQFVKKFVDEENTIATEFRFSRYTQPII